MPRRCIHLKQISCVLRARKQIRNILKNSKCRWADWSQDYTDPLTHQTEPRMEKKMSVLFCTTCGTADAEIKASFFQAKIFDICSFLCLSLPGDWWYGTIGFALAGGASGSSTLQISWHTSHLIVMTALPASLSARSFSFDSRMSRRVFQERHRIQLVPCVNLDSLFYFSFQQSPTPGTFQSHVMHALSSWSISMWVIQIEHCFSVSCRSRSSLVIQLCSRASSWPWKVGAELVVWETSTW